MGSGSGKISGSQKFVCKRDHAAFVPLTSVIPEKYFDGNLGKAARQEAQGKWEQIHEDEMYTRSMSCVNIPSGRQMIWYLSCFINFYSLSQTYHALWSRKS